MKLLGNSVMKTTIWLLFLSLSSTAHEIRENLNSGKRFINGKLRKSKICEIKLAQNFYATGCSSFIRSENFESFCFSGKLNDAFASRFQP